MKTLNQYIIERFLAKQHKPAAKSQQDIYDYIVTKYNLESITDCTKNTLCPEKIDLTDVKVPIDFDTSELFSDFRCEEIDISNWKINKLSESTFAECYNLKNITIPKTVTSIGKFAFFNCKNLEGIVLPDSVTSIGKYAFAYCKKLKNITIPESVTSIGIYVFDFCDKLETIYTSKGNRDRLVKMLPEEYHNYIKEV